MVYPKPPRVFPTSKPTHRFTDYVGKNIGEAHSRKIDTSDQKDKIDPTEFNQKQLYGVSNRRVFVEHYEIHRILPEVGGHIVKNWDNQQWLESLLRRYNLTPDNIFSNETEKSKFIENGHYINAVRNILLILIGLKVVEVQELLGKSVSSEMGVQAFKIPVSPWYSDNVVQEVKKAVEFRRSK